MCGIIGRVQFDLNTSVDEGLIQRMNQFIAHRGPDDEGVYVKGNVGLGHRRLSIIDLSKAGHMPMSNPEGTVWLTYNGEIYNFQEVRKNLEKKGYQFQSKTDSEVIIYLYEEYGEECVQHLRGMFAFAIWDEKKKKLFLARDRAGQKPLKYYLGKDFIVFGSALRGFFECSDVPKEIDFEAVNHYLTMQYVPHPLTGFKGIQKLPPGHYLSIDLSKDAPQIKMEPYWKWDHSQKDHYSEQEWQEKILDLFEESVKLRLISDVPLGAFLSGGVDSSAVVAMMAKNSNQPVKTFSIGFEEADYNELPYARQIAEQFETDHKEFIVKPDALDILPDLIEQYEEPYGDSSAIPTWYLSRLTREHVTVALNGDAGDENFAGYGKFPPHLFAEKKYRHIPGFLRKGLIIPGAKLFNKIHGTTFSERALRFVESFEKGRDVRFMYYFDYFTPEQKQAFYTDKFLEGAKGAQSTPDWFQAITGQSGSPEVINRALHFMGKSYLPDDLLVKVDVATMAFGLEGRSPLLDHHFLEMVSKMPYSFKLRGKQTKYIFKKALEQILPKDIIYRKKKGFSVPIEHWFRHELKDYTKEHLLADGAAIHQWIKKEAIEAVINEHLSTRINNAYKLWVLLTLELWLKKFFI